MRKLPLIARILLGLIFTLAGAFGLLNSFTMPPNLPENLQTFMMGLLASKYFLPFLKTTETLCGILLLSGFFVPLALVILAPIIINIFLVHLFLAPSGVPLAVVLGALEIYLAVFAAPYKGVIKQLFRRNASS